jgi:hypothetical protein
MKVDDLGKVIEDIDHRNDDRHARRLLSGLSGQPDDCPSEAG